MEAKLTAQAEQLARALASQASTVDDLNALFRGLMKSALQRMLDTQRDVPLGHKHLPAPVDPPDPPSPPEAPRNRRNGPSQKTAQGELGEVRLGIPRDRNGPSAPQLIGTDQRRLSGCDDKILALDAKGLTTRDIREVVQELYGVEVSATLISGITADRDGEVSSWRSRRLDAVWPLVSFAGLVLHVRGAAGRVSQHPLYVAPGVNPRGRKELLGLWLAESEGAKFWLSRLRDLKSRGPSDILVACVDGLTGFPEATRAAYPQTRGPLGVVHLVRAALKDVSDEDSREVVKDLKAVYRAATAAAAEQALARFAEKWDSRYPTIRKQWRLKGSDIVALFEFPPEIRKAIDTTDAIESVTSAIRKCTRPRKQYPGAARAVRLIYRAITEASKRWTMPIVGWKQALNHFAILFEGRLPARLTS
jgi:transposase-like protein